MRENGKKQQDEKCMHTHSAGIEYGRRKKKKRRRRRRRKGFVKV